jgi:hypothetical protein
MLAAEQADQGVTKKQQATMAVEKAAAQQHSMT